MHSPTLPLSRRFPRPSLPARCLALAAVAAVAAISGFIPAALAQQVGPSAARLLAPGVLTTIPPDFAPEETVSTHDVVEIRANPALQWNPDFLALSNTLYGMADDVKFRRDIWCLEFSFKPLRMIEVDVPLAAGGTQRKLVWYFVYRVRNTGHLLKPVASDDGVYTAELVEDGPIRFLPQFVLESQDRLASGEPTSIAYLDRVIPAAVAAIAEREGQTLRNSVEMAEQPIPASGERAGRGVWGVATWTDVDPRIDFFSVYAGGLTNAYRWEDMPGAFRPGDAPGKGRAFARKTLQLNFWRPGDELLQGERELRYGVPLGMADLYGVRPGLAYRWIYR